MLLDSCKPSNPKITPIIMVLNACASPAKKVTCVTSFMLQFSFLPMERTGNQWLGITACNKLNKILPKIIWFIIFFSPANIFYLHSSQPK